MVEPYSYILNLISLFLWVQLCKRTQTHTHTHARMHARAHTHARMFMVSTINGLVLRNVKQFGTSNYYNVRLSYTNTHRQTHTQTHTHTNI